MSPNMEPYSYTRHNVIGAFSESSSTEVSFSRWLDVAMDPDIIVEKRLGNSLFILSPFEVEVGFLATGHRAAFGYGLLSPSLDGGIIHIPEAGPLHGRWPCASHQRDFRNGDAWG